MVVKWWLSLVLRWGAPWIAPLPTGVIKQQSCHWDHTKLWVLPRGQSTSGAAGRQHCVGERRVRTLHGFLHNPFNSIIFHMSIYIAPNWSQKVLLDSIRCRQPWVPSPQGKTWWETGTPPNKKNDLEPNAHGCKMNSLQDVGLVAPWSFGQDALITFWLSFKYLGLPAVTPRALQSQPQTLARFAARDRS